MLIWLATKKINNWGVTKLFIRGKKLDISITIVTIIIIIIIVVVVVVVNVVVVIIIIIIIIIIITQYYFAVPKDVRQKSNHCFY